MATFVKSSPFQLLRLPSSFEKRGKGPSLRTTVINSKRLRCTQKSLRNSKGIYYPLQASVQDISKSRR